jgi:hypothetical protein
MTTRRQRQAREKYLRERAEAHEAEREQARRNAPKRAATMNQKMRNVHAGTTQTVEAPMPETNRRMGDALRAMHRNAGRPQAERAEEDR